MLWVYLIGTGLTGAALGFFAYDALRRFRVRAARETAEEILEAALREAEAARKEVEVHLKELACDRQMEIEEEIRVRRAEIARIEERLRDREEQLLQRQAHCDARERELDNRQARLSDREQELERLEEAFAAERRAFQERLAEIGKLSVEAARRQLMAQIAVEARHDAAQLARRIEAEMRETFDQRARITLATAIERCAADFIAENSVVAVSLPNDEMKGRIIGKEGRNIRAFELYSGVDLIIDDTPEAILLSSYDPMRRDIARRALEALIHDGRIHPARIEQMVSKARGEVQAEALRAARETAQSLDVVDLPDDLLQMLGRLRYRTSYGQNVLEHSREVAIIAGSLAAEIGENVALAKRAGLLHDIGKAEEHFTNTDHVQTGLNILRRHDEDPAVLHAIEAHHGAVEPKTALAVLMLVADRVSAARPGARSDSLQQYVRRLEDLERIAESYDGVEQAFAIHAGRELRVIVEASRVNDDDAYLMAKEIARRVQNEVRHPGPVQVTVIRELRATAFARPNLYSEERAIG